MGGCCTTSECEDTLDGVQNFLLSGGVFTPISVFPGEVYAVADDINNDGVIVGFYQDAAGITVGFMATTVRWGTCWTDWRTVSGRPVSLGRPFFCIKPKGGCAVNLC